MADDFDGILDDGFGERTNYRRKAPSFLEDERKQNDTKLNYSKAVQPPSFLNPSIDNKTANQDPIFESRRRNVSPSVRMKQKETHNQKRPESPLTDDEMVSNADSNVNLATPNKKEDPYSMNSNILDNSYTKAKKVPTSNLINEKERNRYENEVRELEYRMKKKEDQYINEIEQLKQSHKEEIASYQKILKTKEKEYNDEIGYLRMEKTEEVKNTKESMALMNKNEIDSMEKKTERLLREQKMKYDSENDTLKRQLEQQIEYNKLATKVESSSKHIDELMQRIQNEKEIQMSDSRAHKISLEKLQERLEAMEDNLNKDKELFNKEREAFEQSQMERKKLNAEESVRIKAEITRLEQLQSRIRSEEYSIKEKYEKEKIDLSRRYDEMKLELEAMKTNYQSKVNEVEYQRKMFEEEKKYFDKYKEDTLKNIDNKKYELENLKEKFYSEEKEIQSRISIMQEKDLFLTEKFDEFEKVRLAQNKKEEKIEKDRKELIIAARRIEDSIKVLDEKGRLLEKERNELMKQYNEIESEKMNTNSEKIVIDQEKAEIRLRLQSIDMLRMKYITENRPMLNITSTMHSIPNLTANHFMSKTMMSQTSKMNPKPIDSNYYSTIHSNRNAGMNMTASKDIGGGFNADKYFDSLKNRIHSNNLIESNDDIYDEGNKFNRMIIKERDYLKKRNELYENNAKNDYEKMKKNHFDSMNITSLKSENVLSPPMQQRKEESFEMKKKEPALDDYDEIQNDI